MKNENRKKIEKMKIENNQKRNGKNSEQRKNEES